MNSLPKEASVDSYLRALAVAALQPSLRSALLLNARQRDIDFATNALGSMLAAAVGCSVKTTHLAPYHDEIDLWGVGEGLPELLKKSGLLVTSDMIPEWRVVTISDLSNMNFIATRAFVQLAENELAHIEQYGRHHTWVPKIFWLAACDANMIGKVPAHVLDRFAMRLYPPKFYPAEATTPSVRQNLGLKRNSPETQLPGLVFELSKAIQQNTHLTIVITDKVVNELIVALGKYEDTQGVRRFLNLGRTTVGLAKLDGTKRIERKHIQEAVALFGSRHETNYSDSDWDVKKNFQSSQFKNESISPDPDPEISSRPATSAQQTLPDTSKQGEIKSDESGTILQEPELSDLSTKSPEGEEVQLVDPFPEDTAPIEHVFAPLQPPMVTIRRRSAERGRIVGVKRTSTIRDLAIVQTVFTAIPFQSWRRKQIGLAAERKFILSRNDLRAWRRAPTTDEMLLLLIDFTACMMTNWHSELVPYLRLAYAQRALMCVILVGAEGAPDEFRAEKVLARNVLDPRVRKALSRSPGRATPLADGLQVALNTLRKSLYHGHDTISHVTAVIVTDGRGNVPLNYDSSIRKEKTQVFQEGIQDALLVAEKLRLLRSVDFVVLGPKLSYAKHLMSDLAYALGAELREIDEL